MLISGGGRSSSAGHAHRVRMRIHMHLEVHLALEILATVRTQVWLETGVRAHVRLQIGCPIKGLVADGAGVWLVGCVRQTVAG